MLSLSDMRGRSRGPTRVRHACEPGRLPSHDLQVALERTTHAGREPRAPVGIAGLPVRFPLSGIREDGRGELRQRCAAADQIAGKADQITRLRGYDSATDEATALVVHSHESVGLIVEHAAIDVR